MISDSTLYSLSIFLGSLAMLLIILYHYLEVNSHDDDDSNDNSEKTPSDPAGLADEKAGGVAAGKPAPQARNASASFDKSITAGSLNKGGGSS